MNRLLSAAVLLPLVSFFLVLGCGRNAPDSEKKEEVVLEKTEPAAEPKKELSGQTISFLGTQGTGRRFCIIADCSKSLSPGSFAYIKKELVRTLRSLDVKSSFHLMFFAGTPHSMPKGPWLKGGKEVDQVLPWIDGQERVGGTVAAPAFARAFALDPLPDILFFMTDGQIRDDDPKKVAEMNRFLPKIPVHTILFVKEKVNIAKALVAEMQLKQIAKDSGGTFRMYRGKH